MRKGADQRGADARRRRRREKLSSIIANELIVDDLIRFLDGGGGSALLDLGAGTKPYFDIYAPSFDRCVAVDIGREGWRTDVDVVASADAMPFADEEFDCVICTEMLEHCPDPLSVLNEVRRVLKPGGRAFITTPFMLGLHEEPYDYYRYTPWALRALAQRAGLEVASIEPRGDWLAVALSVLMWPVAKLLSAVPAYRYRNPVVWLLIVAPQLAYLAYWRNCPRVKRWAATPLGFNTSMTKRIAESS
jgi:ubiquinone/menaquinone biosynthesis C-methylase UbiE